MPDFVKRIKLYEEDINLFRHFQIESQIATAYQRKIELKSGGNIVIDHTEAMTTIDVNSSKSKRGKNIEENALQTNLEAAKELSRQMRLRDMGGLIVVDFIDMQNYGNRKKIENITKSETLIDKARIQIAPLSQFGLLEIARQRVRASLAESSHVTCPRCMGQGIIRDTESVSLAILRVIQEQSIIENTNSIVTQAPVEVATFLLNEKRDYITSLEAKFNISILIIPNPFMQTPDYEVKRSKTVDTKFSLAQKSIEKIQNPKNYPIKELMGKKSFEKLFSSNKVKTKNNLGKKSKKSLKAFWDIFSGKSDFKRNNN